MDDYVPITKGGAVLLDELGVMAIKTVPAREYGLVMDLAGRLNKTERRSSLRYLLTIPQAAELIANIIVEAQVTEPGFASELDRAVVREQERVRANIEEHDG